MNELSAFQKLMKSQRKTFSVSVETDSGDVDLSFNYSRKSQQAILFDCGAKKETLAFAFALSEGTADFAKRPSGVELDLVEQAIGNHFLRNELMSPQLSADEREELIKDLDPVILRQIYNQIKAKAFEDVSKN
jgi:hypothetical protein